MWNYIRSTGKLFFVVTIMAICGCGKNPVKVPEENLSISTDAAMFVITPGPDFDFNLSIESAMPTAGVKIETVVTGEIDNQIYMNDAPVTSKEKTTKIKVNYLPRQKTCIVRITVTSKSSDTNKATTNFRVIYK
jgi:hypothetical protein